MTSGYLLTGHLKSIHIKGNDLLPFFCFVTATRDFFRVPFVQTCICRISIFLYMFSDHCFPISHFLDTAFSVYRKSTALRSIWQSTIYLLYFCWQAPSFYIQDIQGSELNRKRLFMSADKPFRPASGVTILLSLFFLTIFNICKKVLVFWLQKIGACAIIYKV